ncbi:MAG: hypothetical protein AMJ46_12615 [Latescibacteria bacterium DG_63]|nr:MAG: hypothetical protein AMJ46_12615 [Latescibacteria bacterium DG_63]
MSVLGLAKVLKALEKEGSAYGDALSAALYQEGLAIDAEAVKRVPVATGRLRSTHYVAPPTDDGVCEVGFGTDYALPVHDKVEVYHEVGGPLYLKSAVDEAQRGYVDRIAKRTSANHRAGVGMRAIPKTAPTKPKKLKSITNEQRRRFVKKMAKERAK